MHTEMSPLMRGALADVTRKLLVQKNRFLPNRRVKRKRLLNRFATAGRPQHLLHSCAAGLAAQRGHQSLRGLDLQFGDLALAHIARQWARLDPQRRRALQRLAREK